MRKAYLIAASVFIGLLLSLIPLQARFDNGGMASLIVPPHISMGTVTPAPVCAMMGVSVGYEYRGAPFMTFIGGDLCNRERTLYPLGVIMNIALVAGIIWAINSVVIRKRSTV